MNDRKIIKYDEKKSNFFIFSLVTYYIFKKNFYGLALNSPSHI